MTQTTEWLNNSTWQEHFPTSYAEKDHKGYKESLIFRLSDKKNLEKDKKLLSTYEIKELESMYLQKLSTYFPNPYTFNKNIEQDRILIDTQKEILLCLAQKKRDEATEILAQFIKKYRIFKTIFSDQQNTEMYYYNDGIYLPEGVSEIKRLSRLILEKAYTTQLGNQVLEKIKYDTLINYKEFFNQEKKDPYLLPVKNGILNVKTLELTPYNPNNVFFNKINAEFDMLSQDTRAQEYIESIVKPQDFNLVQEMLGFLLIREYRYEKAFFCTGEGSNGKSKFFDLIKHFLGEENCSHLSMTDILESPFATNSLHHKLVNISGEISNEVLKNTDIFKRLTGGDLVHADRKFLPPISFVNYAKLIFALNEVPRTLDQSTGFFRRVVIIDFPNKFMPRKEYELLSDSEKKEYKIADPNVIKRLLEPEAMNGLLFWALAGLERILDKGGFSSNKTTKEIKKDWLRRSDSFSSFCEDLIVEDYDERISKPNLKRTYLDYCKRNNIKPQSEKVMRSYLTKNLACWEHRERNPVDVHYWVGIRYRYLKEEEEQEVL